MTPCFKASMVCCCASRLFPSCCRTARWRQRNSWTESIERAAEAITEGRDAVQGLRASTVQTNDLARAINTLGEELAADPANHGSPAFRVTVEGDPRDLHPILRDEIYRIAAEALRNAFRHAEARQVEVEIRYDNQQFRLRVRDDGKGMDTAVLSGEGPEGHYRFTRHAGTRQTDRGEAGGLERSWRRHRSGTDCSCFLRIHDSSEGFVAVAKVCGESMIAIRRNTARALRRASRIVLLCMIHCSFAVAAEPNPAKVVIAQA